MMGCEICRDNFEFSFLFSPFFGVEGPRVRLSSRISRLTQIAAKFGRDTRLMPKPCLTPAWKLSCFEGVRRFCGMSAEPAGKQFPLWCLILYRIAMPS